MDKLQYLSKMDYNQPIKEMIDYLLDNGFVGFINDTCSLPWIEYHMDDLLILDREYFFENVV